MREQSKKELRVNQRLVEKHKQEAAVEFMKAQEERRKRKKLEEDVEVDPVFLHSISSTMLSGSI